MILRYCPDCGQKNPALAGHKDGCRYKYNEELKRSFEMSEREADDIACLAILEERDRLRLKTKDP